MDFNQLIQDSVREVLAETNSGNQALPAANQTTQAQPITVNIQGQAYTFRDQGDLEAQLNQVAIAQSNAATQHRKEEEPAKPQGTRVSTDEDSGFANEEYIRLMNEDPRKATKYALSHLLFDGKVENPEELLRETMMAQATTNRQLATYQFRDAYRDVPVEDPRVGNVLEEVRKSLGLPFTAEGLEAAYIFSVGKGKLPDFRQYSQNQQQNQQPPQQYSQAQPQFGQSQYQPQSQPYNQYLSAPPAPGRGTNPIIPVSMEQIEDMTLEQHGALLRKLQAANAV